MSSRKRAEYTVWDAVTPVAITSSTNATPTVVTATSHGFSTGDLVMIYGHATNTAANGIYKVTRVTADTFSLQDRYTGANIAGNGIGAGTGICVLAPKVIEVTDFTNVVFQITTSGTATTTVYCAGSLGELPSDVSASYGTDTPNFGATVSKSNPYTLLQIIDLLDNSSKDGGTGVVVAGTDIAKQFEVNVNAQKYITFIPASWSAGSISIKLIAYSI